MYFFFGEVAPSAVFELIELDLADCDTGELEYAHVMRLAHTADLSVSALVELKADDHSVFGVSNLWLAGSFLCIVWSTIGSF